jgi:hypothetical protein
VEGSRGLNVRDADTVDADVENGVGVGVMGGMSKSDMYRILKSRELKLLNTDITVETDIFLISF